MGKHHKTKVVETPPFRGTFKVRLDVATGLDIAAGLGFAAGINFVLDKSRHPCCKACKNKKSVILK